MTSETLVLVPPMLCDAGVFGPQILDMANAHAVLFAPTTIGERMEEIASQILSWAPNRFALAGMGMGGMVAMEVLRRAPERVTRIALIATSAHAEQPETAAAREPQIVAARTPARWPEVLQREIRQDWMAPTTNRASMAGHLVQMGRVLGPDVFVRQSRAMQRRKDQQPTLRKITQPALVIGGAHDGQFTLKRQEFMAEMIPHARLEIIENAGYLPTLEAPDQVTAALCRWMQAPQLARL